MRQAVNIIDVYTQRIQTLEFRSARGRMISELLYLAERFGERHGKEVIIMSEQIEEAGSSMPLTIVSLFLNCISKPSLK